MDLRSRKLDTPEALRIQRASPPNILLQAFESNTGNPHVLFSPPAESRCLSLSPSDIRGDNPYGSPSKTLASSPVQMPERIDQLAIGDSPQSRTDTCEFAHAIKTEPVSPTEAVTDARDLPPCFTISSSDSEDSNLFANKQLNRGSDDDDTRTVPSRSAEAEQNCDGDATFIELHASDEGLSLTETPAVFKQAVSETQAPPARRAKPSVAQRQSMLPRELRSGEYTMSLRGQCLHVLCPPPIIIPCPEAGCRKLFTSEKWVFTLNDLKRHLIFKHGLRNMRIFRWCSFCDLQISSKPLSHPCLSDKQKGTFLDGKEIKIARMETACKGTGVKNSPITVANFAFELETSSAECGMPKSSTPGSFERLPTAVPMAVNPITLKNSDEQEGKLGSPNLSPVKSQDNHTSKRVDEKGSVIKSPPQWSSRPTTIRVFSPSPENKTKTVTSPTREVDPACNERQTAVVDPRRSYASLFGPGGSADQRTYQTAAIPGPSSQRVHSAAMSGNFQTCHIPSRIRSGEARVTRIAGDLHVMCPLPCELACPERRCGRIFSAANWTTMLNSMKRHIVNCHQIRNLQVIKWCYKCRLQIKKKPLSHPCLRQFNKGSASDSSDPESTRRDKPAYKSLPTNHQKFSSPSPESSKPQAHGRQGTERDKASEMIQRGPRSSPPGKMITKSPQRSPHSLSPRSDASVARQGKPPQNKEPGISEESHKSDSSCNSTRYSSRGNNGKKSVKFHRGLSTSPDDFVTPPRWKYNQPERQLSSPESCIETAMQAQQIDPQPNTASTQLLSEEAERSSTNSLPSFPGDSPDINADQLSPSRPSTTLRVQNAVNDWSALSSHRNHRQQQTLHLFFPTATQIRCCERRCRSQFNTRSLSSSQKSLTRHLRTYHGIEITQIKKWCTICRGPAGNKPSMHSCLQQQVNTPSDTMNFSCLTCGFQCPSKKGLQNHAESHRRQDQQNQISQPNIPRPDTRAGARGTSQRTTATDDADEPVNEISSAANAHAAGAEQTRQTPRTRTNPTRGRNRNRNSGRNAARSTAVNNVPYDEDHTPAEPTPIDRFVDEFQAIFTNPDTPESWDRFVELTEEFNAFIHTTCKIPPPTERQPGNRRQPNKDDARVLQKMYRSNRRRTIRLLTEPEATRCQVDSATLFDHFRSQWETVDGDTSVYQESEGRTPVNLDFFDNEEVARKLSGCENSAPGPDRVTYHNLRQVDPEARVLTKILNICLLKKNVPDSWKVSKTILIPKRSEPTSLDHWRPIALSSTIYKLLMKCLAGRLMGWVTMNDALSVNQKGFTPHDGVFEHNYILQTKIKDSLDNRKSTFIGWLDLTNAFGSLPHNVLHEAILKAGVGEEFAELVMNIYNNSSTQILSANGPTENIPQRKGVKQGCPLSGLIFNIAIDPAIRARSTNLDDPITLAYADDICVIADSEEMLQLRLDEINLFMEKIGIKLNPEKCRALHLCGKQPVGTRPVNVSINGARVRCLEDGDPMTFLGQPVGYRLPYSAVSTAEFAKLSKAILESKLAPWQRLDAARSFIYPSFQFAMRMQQLPKSDWQKIDEIIRAEIKKTLYLPECSANEYLYGERKSGCCALPIAAEDSDIAMAVGAFKLLTSRDERVSVHALKDLQNTVKNRLHRQDCSTEDLGRFLSGCQDESYATTSNARQNMWTNARKASSRLGLRWDFDEDIPTIQIGDTTIRIGNKISPSKVIRETKRLERSATLQAKRNQGKAMSCVAAHEASSHFMYTGEYTQFADWRFVHRARLNQVPLNGAKPWRAQQPGFNKSCRRCRFPDETLPHVLGHCLRNSPQYQKRHNLLVDRIKKAACQNFSILAENREVGVPGLRPDLVLAAGTEALVIDVTVPFENNRTAFETARQQKINKYIPVVQHLKTQFQKVKVFPFIVGMLGAWDPANDALLRKLCSKKYAQTMRKLCVSTTISESRKIYQRHFNSNPGTALQNQTPIPDGPDDAAPPTTHQEREEGSPMSQGSMAGPNASDTELSQASFGPEPDQNSATLAGDNNV